MRLFDQEMFQRDRESQLYNAYQKGYLEGLLEGKLEVQSLLREGKSLEQIAELLQRRDLERLRPPQ